jgi:hypothetical protein
MLSSLVEILLIDREANHATGSKSFRQSSLSRSRKAGQQIRDRVTHSPSLLAI